MKMPSSLAALAGLAGAPALSSDLGGQKMRRTSAESKARIAAAQEKRQRRMERNKKLSARAR